MEMLSEDSLICEPERINVADETEEMTEVSDSAKAKLLSDMLARERLMSEFVSEEDNSLNYDDAAKKFSVHNATDMLDSNPVKKVATASFVVGLILVGSAVGGLLLWESAEYFYDPGPYNYATWHGYDAAEFWGLMVFMVGSVFGFVLTYVGAEALVRAETSNVTLIIYALCGFASVSVGCAGLLWGKDMMTCFGVFCVGTAEHYVEIENHRPEKGMAFLATVGNTAFLSMVPMGLIMIYAAFCYMIHRRRLRAVQRGEATNDVTTPLSTNNAPLMGSESSGRPLHVLSWDEDKKHLFCIGFGLFTLTFLFGFITTYIPNWWKYFSAARIAHNARLIVTQDPYLCVHHHEQYICPEVSWATFFTRSHRVSENLVLKFFPGNVFFFTYLLALIAFVSVIRCGRKGRLWLKKAMFNTPRLTMSYGEVIVTLATIAMLSAFFHYWLHDHNYDGYWKGGENRGLADSERWARAFGQLGVMFMGLLFFPASRNSVVHHLFGTSWEASLWAHRVLGYLMLVAVLAHMIAWWWKYGQGGLLPKAIFELPLAISPSIDNFTVPMTSLVTWFTFVCMGVLALEPIRRKYFEIFYYAHLAAAYLAIPAVLWHAAASWEYLLPGVTVWFIDRLVRMYRSSSSADVISVKVYGEVTELRFTQKSMTLAPGQYVFINIPEISVFEWHPFTISSSVSSPYFALHIKTMGRNTWSDKLNTLAEKGRTKFSLAVDGPYGHKISYADYKRVILVGGGIGITPCASIFAALKGIPDMTVKLMWTCREVPMVAALAEHLSLSSDVDDVIAPTTDSQVYVFVTCKTSSDTEVSEVTSKIVGAKCRRGRPNVTIDELAEGADPDDVLVFACGPEGMVQDAMKTASQKGYHFHRETFLL